MFTDPASRQALELAHEHPELFGRYIGTVARELLAMPADRRDTDVAFALVTIPAELHALQDRDVSALEQHLVTTLAGNA